MDTKTVSCISHEGDKWKIEYGNIKYFYPDKDQFYRDAVKAGIEFDRKMADPEWRSRMEEEKNVFLEADFYTEIFGTESQRRELFDKAMALALRFYSGKAVGTESALMRPLRAMMKADAKEHTIPFAILNPHASVTALLYGILETECTEEILQEEGIPKEIIKDIKFMTRRQDEDFLTYVNRVNQHGCCRGILKMDIEERSLYEGQTTEYQQALEILTYSSGVEEYRKLIDDRLELKYFKPKADGTVYIECREECGETLKTATIRKNDRKVIAEYGFSGEEMADLLNYI